MQMKTVRVLRAFYYQGKATKVGDVLDLPSVFAKEMHAAHKAEFYDRPAPVAETKPVKDDSIRKGDSHAR